LWVIGLGVTLLMLGLVMTFSASFVQSTAQTGDAFDVFNRQAFWAAIGIPVAFLAAVVDYRSWRRSAPLAVIVTLAAMVLVLFVGEEVNGARRWFELGPFSVQPSEVVKLALPAFVAHMVARRWKRIRRGDMVALLLPAVPVVVVAAALVAVSPDLESAVLVALIGLTPLFIAGLPLRLLTIGGAVLAGLATWAIQSTPYRVGRVAAWLDPTNEAFRDSYGYQTTQGFMALGNGGIWGVGLGQGRGKWFYVPNAHTDFIYAIIGEELGLIGGLTVLVIFAALAWAGCRIASRAPDMYGRLLAGGITVWLTLQAAINISSVVGVLPVTGVTLPLVSFGGSSLVITMAGVGVLVAIARQSRPDLLPPGPVSDDD
jgi:cell division protein FtsW